MCECALVNIPDRDMCVAADDEDRIVMGMQCSCTCPLPHLFTLRHTYHETLQNLERVIGLYNPAAGRESGRVLDMAKFVRQVTDSAGDPPTGRSAVSGIWSDSSIGSGCMKACYRARSADTSLPLCRSCTRYVHNNPGRSCGCSDIASNYDASYLHQFINFREQAICAARDEAEEAAQNLIQALTDPELQQHLLDHHQSEFAPGSTIPYICHGIEHWASESDNRPVLREMDHVLACVTVRFDAVEPGREFLNHVLDESYMVQHRDNYKAIKDTWDFFTSTMKASPAMGRFFSNVAPVIVMRIRGLIMGELSRAIRTQSDSVARVMMHPQVQSVLAFLDDKFDVDVTSIVRRQAREYGQRSVRFIEQANVRRNLQRAMSEWGDAQPHTSAQKLEGAGFGISLSAISFGLAMAKLLKDWERQEIKDWLSVIGGAVGLAETLSGEIRQGVEAAAGRSGTTLSASAQVAAVSLSRIAMVVQVVTASMDIAQAMDSREYDEAGVAAAGLAAGFTGSVAGMITTFGPGMGVAAATLSMAAVVASVCLVVALVCVIVLILITDHPLVDYLEKTHWGRPGSSTRYSIADTIDRYYQDLYQSSFSVRFQGSGLGDPHLQIRSAAMNDQVPVEISISPSGSRGSVRIVPVLGSGERHVLTDSETLNWRVHCVAVPGAGREIQIFNCDRLFGVPRGGTQTYRVEAKMDPDADGEIELTARANVRIS